MSKELYNVYIDIIYKINDNNYKYPLIYKDALFNHNHIQNKGFYINNAEDIESKESKESNILIEEFNIKLPLSENYITIENLNAIINSVDEENNTTKSEDISEFVKILKINDKKICDSFVKFLKEDTEFNIFLFNTLKNLIDSKNQNPNFINFIVTEYLNDLTQDRLKESAISLKYDNTNTTTYYKNITTMLDNDTIVYFLSKFNDMSNQAKRLKLLPEPNRYNIFDNSNNIIKFQLNGTKSDRDNEILSIIEKIKELITTFKNSKKYIHNYFGNFRDKNNLIEFFLINETNNSTQHITEYFRILDENLKENEKEELKRKDRYANGNRKDISEYNTRKKQKSILYKYGKYLYSEGNIESLNEDSFYDIIKTDKELIKQIITYYNIYTILNEIITPKGTFINSFSSSNKKQMFYDNENNKMEKN